MKNFIYYTLFAVGGLSAAWFLNGFLQYFIPILCGIAILFKSAMDNAVEMPADFDDESLPR